MDEAAIESRSIALVRRRWARVLVGLAASTTLVPFLGLAVAGIVHSEALDAAASGALAPGSLGSLALAAAALFLESFASYRPGALRREGGQLRVTRRGRRPLVIRGVRAGFIVPAGREARAELHLGNGDVLSVRTADNAAAEAVLRAARVDAASQRARIPLGEPLAQIVAFLMLVSVLGAVSVPLYQALAAHIPATAAGVLWMLAVGLTSWLGMHLVSLPEATVGTDGVSLRRGVFRSFIPLAEIDEIRSMGLSVVMRLRGGRVRTLRSLTGADPSRCYALDLRVREAKAARAGERPLPQLDLLDRKGRAVSEWCGDLAGLARRGPSYRNVGLSPDDLEAIVVSTDATPERRLGAALALSASGHPAAPERIRVAAAQCASVRMRVALERASAGAFDEAAIEEALAETEAAQTGAARA